MFFNIPNVDNLNYPDGVIKQIADFTDKWNADNISRTNAYFYFYQLYPEIEWSFLASMVSRNAGYNMCDLEGEPLIDTLSVQYRNYLFMTYERANYLIFRDAFPQLLLYHYSTILNKNMFHFLSKFLISSFMEQEWQRFWQSGDRQRLMTALIINEQNVIQKPVVEEPFYNKTVFKSGLFRMQDFMKMSMVVFPTLEGELYGLPVHRFTIVGKRIELGKSLSKILFMPKLYEDFYQFASVTEHTGSRLDYEQYFPYRKRRETPFLRSIYPIVNHPIMHFNKWDEKQRVKKKWFKPAVLPVELNITKFHKRKKQYLQRFSYLYRFLKV